MTEERIGHLYQAAAILDSQKHAIFKSYYLMKCYEITRGFGLPKKHFAVEKRCSHCFVDWTTGMFETKVTPLNKKQIRKIKLSKHVDKTEMLHSTQLERKCLFCKSITLIRCPKPSRIKTEDKQCKESQNKIKHPKTDIKQNSKSKQLPPKSTTIDVYAKSQDIFSLENKNNTIASTTSKVIKNNKKKKEKYAGLCEAAVLASAKLKHMREQESTNKLNLFLKPFK